MRRSSALSAIFSAFLVVLLCLPAVSLAVTQGDLDDALKRAEDARRAAEEEEARARALEGDLAGLDSLIAGSEAELRVIRAQVADVEARRVALDAEIADLELVIATTQQEIEITETDLVERNRLLGERAAETYKQGDFFYLELLLEADNLMDLMARTSYVQIVIEADSRVAMELRNARRSLEAAKSQLDRDLETLDTKRQEVLAEEAVLDDLLGRQERELARQSAALDEKADLLVESEENAERLRKLAEQKELESQRIAEELAAQASQGSGVYDGEFAWPVPGYYRITSPFGPRTCPYHGQENHSGIDVGSNRDPYQSINGQPIIAAGHGTVIKASYYSGYGYTVMIDHGDGLVSLYPHQQAGGITVSEGQYVVKGMRIGTVGSTGYSTGPHLHFEVRVNGSPVNPMNYLD
jgi:murein DD-endopeptidase MepM/ murein hydrolase activator NlpD